MTIKIWRDFPRLISPFIQTMDLMHAFGLAVTPIVTQPFLSDFRNVSTHDVVANDTASNKTAIFPGFGYNIQSAFLIIGASDVVIAFLCLLGIALREQPGGGQADAKPPLLSERRVSKDTSRRTSMDHRRESGDRRTSIDRRTSVDRQYPVERPPQGEPRHVSFDKYTTKDTRRASTDMRRSLIDRRASLPADRLAAIDRRGSNPVDRRMSMDRRPSTGRRGSIALSIIRRASKDAGVPLLPMDEYTHHRRQYHTHKVLFVSYLIIGFLFFIVNGGRDITLAGLLYTYVTKYLKFSTDTGALLVTVYHMIRTFGHLVVILLARWVRPLWVGVADICFLVLAAVALTFTYNLSNISVWVCVSLTAFATCNIYPTSLSIVEDTMPVTAKISGLLFCGMALGQMLFSLMAGQLLEKSGAIGVPVVLLASALGCLLLFIPLIIIGKKLKLPDSDEVFEIDVQPASEVALPDERTPLLKFQKRDVT